MADPYKVIVWGTGTAGTVAVWEVQQLQSFELVGVRCYDPKKHGRDAGSLLGVEDIGVAMTTDTSYLLSLDCDCVIFTARDTGDFNTDDEILAILAAGKNVVTPLPYHNFFLFRDPEFTQRMSEACKQGNSVFHATGIDPDLVSDRIVPSLTGMCTDVRSLMIQENWDASTTAGELLAIMGYGLSADEARQVLVAPALAVNFLKSIGYTMEKTLGVVYDRVEIRHDYIEAETVINSPNMRIPAGRVGCVTHRFLGYIDSKGGASIFTMEYNWFIGDQMLPPGINPGEKWVVTIEGRPSLKTVINLKASHQSSDRTYSIGSIQTEPGYHGIVAPCLQAIPQICKAEAGILPSFGATLNWKQNF